MLGWFLILACVGLACLQLCLTVDERKVAIQVSSGLDSCRVWHTGVDSVDMKLCLYMGETQMDFKVVIWLESTGNS
jgi:hypothetical protein